MANQADQRHKKGSNVSLLNKYLSFFILMCVIVVGLTLANIMHFWIEDTFLVKTAYNPDYPSSYLFGWEYATSLSCLLIAGFMYILLAIWQRTFAYKNQNSLTYGKTKFIYILGMIVFALASVVYITGILYSYLSGKSDIIGLYRVLVTIGFNLLGVLYTWVVIRYEGRLLPNIWFYGFMSAIIICLVFGVKLSFIHAHPHTIKQYREDLAKAKHISKIAGTVEKYYINHRHTLPPSLTTVMQTGLLQHDELKTHQGETYVYHKKGESLFDICATFSSHYKAAHRISRYRPNIHYKKGEHCARFSLKKNGAGKTTLITIHV